jgi:hypothetical protein
MTTKLIPIKKVLHCPFCQEGSTGLIYPDGALAEAHSDGGIAARHTSGSVDSFRYCWFFFFIHYFEPNRSNYCGCRYHDNNYV